MSAENQIAVFPMANGEIWIVVQACMDHCGAGSIQKVVAKTPGYEAAREAFHRADDEKSPDYVYTEYGGRMPSADELARMPIGYPKSVVDVRVAGRNCDCVTSCDLMSNHWEVTERALGLRESRQLASGVTYAEAITIANQHAAWSPGEHEVRSPYRFVRSFVQSKCDCWNYPGSSEMLPAVHEYSTRYRWY